MDRCIICRSQQSASGSEDQQCGFVIVVTTVPQCILGCHWSEWVLGFISCSRILNHVVFSQAANVDTSRACSSQNSNSWNFIIP